MKKNSVKRIITTLLTAALLVSGAAFSLTSCSESKDESTEFSYDLESMLAGKTFRPSDLAFPLKDTYEFPFMGITAKLSDGLKAKISDGRSALLTDEYLNDDGQIHYAILSINNMTQEQKEAEYEMLSDGYYTWADSLERTGALGMYESSMSLDEISSITKCDTHKAVRSTPDGKYVYYLSTNSSCSADDTALVLETETELMNRYEMPDECSAFWTFEDLEAATADTSTTIADINAETLDGKSFTGENLAEYDLTLVNVFATTCSPCISEMPELEKLYQEYKDKGVNIIGIVHDVVDGSDMQGNLIYNSEYIETAKLIQSRTGVTYPVLLPDSYLMFGRLSGIQAYPETFFVDKNGNIVGKTYSGSHSYDEWKEIIEKTLEEVR